MRKYLISLFGALAAMILAAWSDGTQTIAEKAIAKTDSVYNIGTKFDDLRFYLDSVNAVYLAALEKASVASAERDSTTQAMLRLMEERNELVRQNIKYQDSMELMSEAPHYLFVFLLVFAATLISHGAFESIKRKKTDEKHDE